MPINSVGDAALQPTPSGSREPAPGVPCKQRVGAVGEPGHDDHRPDHREKLWSGRQMRVNELRQEGDIKDDCLGVGDGDQETVQEDSARRPLRSR